MDDIIALDAYPLHQPGPALDRLIASAQADLARDGMFNLPGFLRPAALTAIRDALAPRFATDAFHHARRHNIYFRRDVPGLPQDHPALALLDTSSRTLCADQIGGALMALHDWPPVAAFLAAVMGKPALFPMADPLACVNAMAYGPGEGLNWHFDRSEFTTTLLLQAPESGGLFEYRTGLRSADHPNHDGVARLLAGQDPDVRQMVLTPGTLNVFRGRDTAHRVTPAQGPTPRIVAVLSYFDQPGQRMSDDEQRGFYGRSA
jgi:hypothetical protein